jgi:DNA-binding transcriptional LysR family regulator
MTSNADYLVRRLRLRHLELLVALADAGTLRAAAMRLNLSQPALSKMLAEIETGFGARLFERSPHGVLANALGNAVVYRARVILGELARGKDEVDALRTGAMGVLRVGTLSVTSAVPKAVVQLRRGLPAARVQILEGRVRELIQRLLDGELDCVFGAITPELLSSDLLPQLRPEVLLEDELCVLCAADHPLARRRGLRWADLHAVAWVAPPKDTLVRQAFMTAFLNGGLEPPEPAIEVLSSVSVGSLLRMDSALLGAVRLEHAQDELSRAGLRRLTVTPAVPLPSLGLYTRRASASPAPLVQAFAAAIRRVGVRVRGADA